MPRPEKPFRPLTGGSIPDTGIRSIDLIRAIVKKALFHAHWIFDPTIKRWWTPEDFLEQYERFDNLDSRWIDKLEIKDPIEGLEAADIQIESILSRKAILTKKIIDYCKKEKPKTHK